jgi:hypothetical protein
LTSSHDLANSINKPTGLSNEKENGLGFSPFCFMVKADFHFSNLIKNIKLAVYQQTL